MRGFRLCPPRILEHFTPPYNRYPIHQSLHAISSALNRLGAPPRQCTLLRQLHPAPPLALMARFDVNIVVIGDASCGRAI